MKKHLHEEHCDSKLRIPFGILLFLTIWLASVLLLIVSKGYAAIPAVIVLIILYLFLFGKLGWWLLDFDVLGAINPFLLYFGKICGYIGFFIRPFPILLYGANKKWILNVFIVIPIAIIILLSILIVFDILPSFNMDNAYYKVDAIKTAVISIVYALFMLGIKKCPACKCVMSEIDFDSVEFNKTKYYQSASENIGYIKDADGNTADVYRNVIYEHDGVQNKFATAYTCKKCGTVKYGIKFNAITRL